MPNTEYITQQGDRWDTISYKAYGDATNFGPIQDANPNIPITDVFEGGVRLIIPIKEDEISTNLDLLPPWKREQANIKDNAAAAVDLFSELAASSGESFDKSFD